MHLLLPSSSSLALLQATLQHLVGRGWEGLALISFLTSVVALARLVSMFTRLVRQFLSLPRF